MLSSSNHAATTNKTTAWAGTLGNKVSLNVCSRSRIWWEEWFRKISQDMFLILKINSEQHPNKDYFENFLFFHPYVHRRKQIKIKNWYKLNEEIMPLQFSQMKPIIWQMLQGCVAQCHRNSDCTQILRHSGKDLPTILQNICVKYRWLNFYSQPLLCIQQLCGFFKHPNTTVKVIASASGHKEIIWRRTYQQGWKHLSISRY